MRDGIDSPPAEEAAEGAKADKTVRFHDGFSFGLRKYNKNTRNYFGFSRKEAIFAHLFGGKRAAGSFGEVGEWLKPPVC